MKVKEESEEAGLQLNIQKTKITAPSPITSWQTDGEPMETLIDFIFLGSKITAYSWATQLYLWISQLSVKIGKNEKNYWF